MVIYNDTFKKKKLWDCKKSNCDEKHVKFPAYNNMHSRYKCYFLITRIPWKLKFWFFSKKYKNYVMCQVPIIIIFKITQQLINN